MLTKKSNIIFVKKQKKKKKKQWTAGMGGSNNILKNVMSHEGGALIKTDFQIGGGEGGRGSLVGE